MPTTWPPGSFAGGIDRPIGAQVNRDDPQAEKLILAIPFWDGSGTRAEDATGNRRYWSPTVPAWPVDPVFGPVAKTTSNGFSQVANNPLNCEDASLLFDLTHVFVSAWVNFISFSETIFGFTPGVGIFGTRSSGAAQSPSLCTIADNTHGGGNAGQGIAFVTDGSSIAVGVKGLTTVTTGIWYHVAGSFLRDTTVTTYAGLWNVFLNGRLDNSTTNNYSLAGASAGSFSGNPWAAGGNSLLMADLRVYSGRTDHAALAASLYDPLTRWNLYRPSRTTRIGYGLPTGWALVQKAGNQNLAAGTTITVSFPGAVTAGNLIVVGVVQYNALADVLTVSDNKGNVYAAAGTRAANASVGIAAIYWTVATTGGSSFSVTFSVTAAGSYLTLMIGEFSFAPGSTISVDGYSASTGSGAHPTSGTITPVTSGDLVIGAANLAGATSPFPTSGFTLPAEWIQPNPSGEPGLMEYMLSASGPLSAGFDLGSAPAWAMAGAAFKATVAATAPAGGASLLMGL